MTILNTIILGITTSFIASLIFSFIFTQLKPKIKISKVISYYENSFKIKIINKSCFSATNIKAEISYINFFDVPNGIETNSAKIELVKKDFFALAKFDKNSEYATYTYRLKTKKIENLREGLNKNNREYIRLKIFATHSLSNIGKVFEQKYKIEDIVNGDFAFGNTFEII